MSLEADLGVTAGDGAVEFALTVTNVGSDVVDLEFRSGKEADVAVYEDGTEVWRWSEGKLFTQALRTETLAPGESLVRVATWENPPPGEYTAEASLEATNAALVERTGFEV